MPIVFNKALLLPVFRQFAFFHSIPIEFVSDEDGIIEIRNCTTKSLAIVGLYLCNSIVRTVFLWMQIRPAIDSSTENFILHAIWICGYSASLGLGLWTFWKRVAVVKFLNFFLNFHESLEGENEKADSEVAKVLVLLAALSGPFVGVVTSLRFLENPLGIPTFYCSAGIFKSACSHTPFVVFMACYFGIETTIAYHSMLLHMVIIVAYFYTTSASLDSRIRYSPSEKCVESDQLIYRCYQLVHREFTNLFSGFVLPLLHCDLLAMFVLANFTVIRLIDKISLTLFLLSIFIIVLSTFSTTHIVEIAASLSTSSRRLIAGRCEIFSLPTGCIASSRVWKSCAPVKVRIGSWYYIDKSRTIRTLGFILYLTMRTLLFSREKRFLETG